MKKNIFLAAVLIVLLGLLVLTLYKRTMTSAANRPQRIGYTIIFQTTAKDMDGRFRPVGLETRYVSAAGNFRGVKHNLMTGTEKVWFGEVGRGEFAVDQRQQHLSYVSPLDRPTWMTMERLQSTERFNRVETVAGYEAAVMRFPDQDDPNNSYAESYYAPALNGEFVKTRVVDEGQVVSITEPIAIVIGEPDPANLAHDEYPVDTTNFQHTHGEQPDSLK